MADRDVTAGTLATQIRSHYGAQKPLRQPGSESKSLSCLPQQGRQKGGRVIDREMFCGCAFRERTWHCTCVPLLSAGPVEATYPFRSCSAVVRRRRALSMSFVFTQAPSRLHARCPVCQRHCPEVDEKCADISIALLHS